MSKASAEYRRKPKEETPRANIGARTNKATTWENKQVKVTQMEVTIWKVTPGKVTQTKLHFGELHQGK